MYSITFSSLAERQLKKLNKEMKLRIISVLKRCQIRPYPHVTKLVDSPFYRLRMGDYRIILDIKDNKLLILIIEIGHRKNIYKK